MAQAPPDLVFRSYRPEDEEACELLEERADQFRNPKLQETFLVGGILKRLQDSVQVYLSYGGRGFDARARVAEDHEIVVCELQNNVVAVVLINIQTVVWKEALIKVGWVYGLRVDQDYQRRGIGRCLSAGGGTALFGKGSVPAVPNSQRRERKGARALQGDRIPTGQPSTAVSCFPNREGARTKRYCGGAAFARDCSAVDKSILR
jgi:predicted N-acetyltransferase YhbS